MKECREATAALPVVRSRLVGGRGGVGLICAVARFVASVAFVGLATISFGQYPQISSEIAEESNRRMAASDARSDKAFERALPTIHEWEAKGKPYIPDAAVPGDLPQAGIPAFPGAWGGGMHSFGGRGGEVYVVSNLNDDGPGSFREACEAGGPRVIVFNVAGIIQLKDRIRIRAPYVTISGATAPGDGVCVAGNTVELETHDVIVRHMRFRRGDTWVGDRNDSIGGNPIGNIMIDHVSASWGLDENMSMYRHMYRPEGSDTAMKLPTVNITIQNSIFSEALNIYHHAFGSTIGGLNSTFHRNLWACNTGRNPSVGMYGDFTLANNVLYNWRHRTVDGGDHRSEFNIINNYFKPGSVTPLEAPISYRLLKPESQRSRTVVDNFGKAYVAGNIVEGNERVTRNNWDGGVQPDSRAPVDEVLPRIRRATAFEHAPLEIVAASVAYEEVLQRAGATLPVRDPVDSRVIRAVRTGKAKATVPDDIQDQLDDVGYSQRTIDEIVELIPKGIITHPSQVGGYPSYRGKPYKDKDGDGLPDRWEKRHGLNPEDATDAVADLNGDGYTNIEDFINGLDPRAPRTDWTDLRNNVDPRHR